MANTFAPFGFSQRQGTGSSPTYEQTQGTIDYNTAAIFLGDPIYRLSDGSLAGNTTGPGGNATLAGIFVGCHYLSVAIQRQIWNNYWPGSDVATGGNATCYYINDPNAQFLAQAGNSTTIGVAAGNIGMNCNYIYGTGNTTSHISGAAIDAGLGFSLGGNLPFRVVSLVTAPPGAPGTAPGAYNYAVVAFNNVETKNTTAQN